MNGLFEILNPVYRDNKAKADIVLNPLHNIFKGHYPGQPVLPGACMLQIIKDTLVLALGKKMRLKNSTVMKFLSMVDPEEINILKVTVYINSESDLVSAKGDLSADGKIFFKFQGSFVPHD